jgi:hypothetical protein
MVALMATWEDVRRIALSLPEATEDQSGREHHWNVRKKGFVWERPLRPADVAALGPDAPDGPILGVRVEHEGIKHALIADDPGAFFTTPHFDGYPAVLVRLDAIGLDVLEEVIVESWLLRAPKTLVRAFEAAGGRGAP